MKSQSMGTRFERFVQCNNSTFYEGAGGCQLPVRRERGATCENVDKGPAGIGGARLIREYPHHIWIYFCTLFMTFRSDMCSATKASRFIYRGGYERGGI